ncbi:Permease of the drug/metabolite transporter (DMT) superfamily [Salinibacillus kushneri]|uniref:Permease of the drug/metabolite transporter (DMT) superfamily n=1 Tax=Salinibacillus kushneri TaxID=237682 RepID=A0A1I0CBC1_9BACI|nr:DMT family transporter [Salinibacillus kushneri]SET16188.1 Permease of the drug/metabolite transporter (DMT) superfamily [Salinibacillus kushneri]
MKNIYILLLLVMLLWGFNISAVKVLVSNIDPILLTSIRIFVAGISVLVIAYFINIFRFPNKKEWKLIFFIAIFNVIVHHSTVALGLTITSGVNAGLILGMGPLVTVLFSALLLRKQVTVYRIAGFISGFIGVIITILTGAEGFSSISIGDLLVFLGMLTQAYSFILISKLNPSFDPRLLTGYMLIIGSFFVFIISLFNGSHMGELTNLIHWKIGFVFLFSAVFCTAIGHMIYNFAIKKVGPAESAIFINFNTFFAVLGAAIFLKETITYHHLVGLVFIVAGVLMGSGTIDYWLKMKHQKEKGI